MVPRLEIASAGAAAAAALIVAMALAACGEGAPASVGGGSSPGEAPRAAGAPPGDGSAAEGDAASAPGRDAAVAATAEKARVAADGRGSAKGRGGGEGGAAAESDPVAVGDGAHPWDDITDEALETRLLNDPASLGSISIGVTDQGRIVNAVRMPEGERWTIVEPYQAWGTQETIDSIVRAIDKVHEAHPGAPSLYVGDISRKYGGNISPHQHHQTGRDVDLGFYYSGPRPWYRKAYRQNLDLALTWSLVKALVTETDLELIFCDRYVIALIRDHAKEAGEDPAFLRKVFSWRSETSSRPLIRHEDGHRTHIHVRFHDRETRRSGHRIFPMLRRHKLLRMSYRMVEHRVAPGEDIRSVARMYKTSQRAIRRVNELPRNELHVGKTYTIPKRVKLERPELPGKGPTGGVSASPTPYR